VQGRFREVSRQYNIKARASSQSINHKNKRAVEPSRNKPERSSTVHSNGHDARYSQTADTSRGPRSLSAFARSKLQLYATLTNKDNCSLQRWVLLKNSIINPVISPSSASFQLFDAHYSESEDDDPHSSEARWLDALLETLGDEEDDYFGSDSEATIHLAEDDDGFLAPPISSSDYLPPMEPS
jgi:hypothetical protein